MWYKLLASLKGGLPMARDDLDFSVHVDFHSMGIYRHVGSDVILGFGAMEMGSSGSSRANLWKLFRAVLVGRLQLYLDSDQELQDFARERSLPLAELQRSRKMRVEEGLLRPARRVRVHGNSTCDTFCMINGHAIAARLVNGQGVAAPPRFHGYKNL